MTIIVFLIDTSASMNQRAYLGGRPTLLDVAKGAVETFVKVRQRSPESRGDRYMLLTFEDPPQNIKAGWKENLGTFMNELKNLQCQGMTTMGAALKHAFDVLNINRMQTGIDTYGQGRCPFFLEPSVIVVITDGGKLSNNTGVQEEFNLPMHSPIPGCELTREPFRWDQRLFSLVLRLAGTPAQDRDTGLVPSDSSPIDAMCEVTGGRSYSVTSHRMLMQCIDSLVQKVQSGVVINFEKIGPDPPPITNDKENIENGEEVKEWDKDLQNKIPNGVRSTAGVGVTPVGGPNTAWTTCRKLIYVPRSAQKGFPVGFWPIPESFWPDAQGTTLPPRSAHPNVKFTCDSQEPMVIENLPFDKYELEPSPLTQYILARKQPTVCWQVFVPNSYKNSEVGHPFGYLKASTNLSCVNLFVMPYNYPVLLPLLDELFKVHRQKHTPEWRTAFTNYLRTMPAYYAGPLRRALTRMGATGSVAQNLIPENMDNSLSFSVLNYLKRLKNQAKIEYEKLCAEVSNKQLSKNSSQSSTEGVRVTPRSPLRSQLLSHPLLMDKFQSLREQVNEFGNFVVGVGQRRHRAGQSFRNAFDIPRKNLLDQILRMRANFLNPSPAHTKLQDDDVVHSMPISQMGNYQEYLKKTPPQLREVESTPVRQHMFGNPFKIDKRMMVDEADIDLVGGGGGSGGGGGGGGGSGGGGRGAKRSLSDPGASPRPNPKRKPGPIPRDLVVRRPPPSTTPPPVSPRLPTPPPPSSVSPRLLPPVSPPPSLLLAHSPTHPPGLSEPPPPQPPPTSVPPPPPPPPLVNGDISPLSIEDEEDEPGELEIDLGPPLPSAEEEEEEAAEELGVEEEEELGEELSRPPVLQPYDSAPSEDGDGELTILHEEPPTLLVAPPSYSTPHHSPPLISSSSSRSGSDSSPPRLLGGDDGSSPLPPPQLPPPQSLLAPRPPAVSSSREESMEDIRRHNLRVRSAAYKEVRRPGKNYSALLERLEEMRGPPEVRICLLKDVITESLRFKRRALAGLLDKQLKHLKSNTTAAAAGLVLTGAGAAESGNNGAR